MSETLSQDPDTLGSGYGLASNYQPTSATPSSTVQDPPGSNLPPFSSFSADMDTATGYATDRFLSDTRLLDISNWDYYTEARILDRSENGLSIIASQPQYRPWESKPIDSTSQQGFAQTTAVTTFADAFAQNGVSKLPSFQSQFQTFNEPVTTSEPTLTTLTNLTPVSPNSSSPSLTTLNSNFHTLSAVNPRSYPLVPAPIQAREIPSIQQQFLDERHIQLYTHPTNITTINPTGSIFQSQNGAIIQNSQLLGSPTVVTVIKSEPDLKIGSNLTLAPQDTGLKIQNLHPTHFQNPMATMMDNNGLYNGLDKKLNGINATSGSPTRNDFRKKERRKIRASSLESSAESDGASSNMDIGSESSGQVAAVSSTASFKTHHSIQTNNSIDVDEISGGGGVDKQVKKKRKRCGECIGCQRKDNCGDCAPCRNDKSHQICKQRRCEKLTEKKNLYGDQSYMRGESRRGRGKGRGAGSYRGRKPSGPVSLSNSSVPEPSVPSSRPSPQPVHMLKPEQPVQQQPMAPMPFYADPTRFAAPTVWQTEPAQTWPQGQFIQQIQAPAQPTLEGYPSQQYPNGIYQTTYQQPGFETNTFYTGAVQVLTNARPPSVPDHTQLTPRSNGSYSHTPSPVPTQSQQAAPRNNITGQYQEYVNNQGYVAPSTPTGIDNSSRPSSVNSSTVNVPVSNQNFQQQPGNSFVSVSSTNFSPGSNTNPNYVNANSGNEKPGYPQVNSNPQLVSHNSSGYPGNPYGGNIQPEEQQTHHWAVNPENMLWETNIHQSDECAKNVSGHDIQYDHNRPPDSPNDHNNRINLNSRIKTMILNKQQSIERKLEDEQTETENKTGHFLWYSHHRRPPEYLNGDGGGVSTSTPSFNSAFGEFKRTYNQAVTISNNNKLKQLNTAPTINENPNQSAKTHAHVNNEKPVFRGIEKCVDKQLQNTEPYSYQNVTNKFLHENILKPATTKCDNKQLQSNEQLFHNHITSQRENGLKSNDALIHEWNIKPNYSQNITEVEDTKLGSYKSDYKLQTFVRNPVHLSDKRKLENDIKASINKTKSTKSHNPESQNNIKYPHLINYNKSINESTVCDGRYFCENGEDATKVLGIHDKNQTMNIGDSFQIDSLKSNHIHKTNSFSQQFGKLEGFQNRFADEVPLVGGINTKCFESKNHLIEHNSNEQSVHHKINVDGKGHILNTPEIFPKCTSPQINVVSSVPKATNLNLKEKHANAESFRTEKKTLQINKLDSANLTTFSYDNFLINGETGKLNENKKKSDAEEKNKFTGTEIPVCNCFPPDKLPPEPGSYYTHLGSSNDLVNLRKDLEERTGVNGKALRIEKLCYTGKEGKSVQGCPLAKWIIRRSNFEEKYLVMVKHRRGHVCVSAYIVICIVAWEGVPVADANNMYSMLSEKLNKYGLATNRRCATNEHRTCACQGLDPKTCGASFSFGCSWSMYYNGCKFARSKIVRKFRLTEKSEEQHVETQLQNLVSDLTPLYKNLAPISFENQCEYEAEAGECRLGNKDGKPFSGVTACLDFCAHAHKDYHNMNNGCTVVVTLTKKRSISKPEDEQLHVLPLYTIDCTDEFGSKECQDNKIKNGSIEVLNRFECEVRLRTVPLQPCRRRKKKDEEGTKELSAKKENVSSRLSSSSGYDSSGSHTPVTPNKNIDQMLQSSQISSTVLDSPVTPKSWTYDSPGSNQFEENNIWYQTINSNLNSPDNAFYNNIKPTVLTQTKLNTAFTPTYPNNRSELQNRSFQSAQSNLLQNKVQDSYSGIRNGNQLLSNCNNNGNDFDTGILSNLNNSDEISPSRTPSCGLNVNTKSPNVNNNDDFYSKTPNFQSEYSIPFQQGISKSPFKMPLTPESPVRIAQKNMSLESHYFGEPHNVERVNYIDHMNYYQKVRASFPNIVSSYSNLQNVYSSNSNLIENYPNSHNPYIYETPPSRLNQVQNLSPQFKNYAVHGQIENPNMSPYHKKLNGTYRKETYNLGTSLENCHTPKHHDNLYKSQMQHGSSSSKSTNFCNKSYQTNGLYTSNFLIDHREEIQNLNSLRTSENKLAFDSSKKEIISENLSKMQNPVTITSFDENCISKSYQLCNPFDDFGDYGIKKQNSSLPLFSNYFCNDPYFSPSKQSPWDVNVLPLPEQAESLGKVVDVIDNSESFRDSQIGGVAIALGHGSVMFECAKHELHATTALKQPNRTSPTRISLVFYQHRNLNRGKHGWDEWEEKTRLKKLGLNDAQNIDLKFKVGLENDKIDIPDFKSVLLKNNNEVLMRAPTLTTVSVTTLFPMYPCTVTGPYTEPHSYG